MAETRTDIPTAYDPQSVEPKWYEFWLGRRYFHAEPDPARKPYVIMMPLPNVTGELHVGHALNNGLQDCLIRWRRMQGRNAMWMPGTDHASIAVHVVIERQLAREGRTRHDLGREAFIERVWQWREQVGTTIYGQLRRMGFSCDWDRVTFTMDPGYRDAVQEAFVRLFDRGLIYKGQRIISWCPNDQTTVSDLEIEQEETESTLYHVRYPFTDGGPGEGIVIATQRPETIVADVAVAVHPDDPRYRTAIGRTVIVPMVHRQVPVIADPRVDRGFGTGALKITPGHDPLDYEIGQSHGLPVLSLIDREGRMTPDAGPLAGMDRFEARDAAVRLLDEAGVLAGTEAYRTSIPRCERCGTVIEPLLMDQWFARQSEMAKRAAAVVRNGTVRFHPERWTKVFLEWMEIAHDWNVSRQLWWGQRIPAWYGPNGEIVASKTEPAPGWVQEEDIFDTWFSSAIWPFGTLGWPKDNPDLRYFYPGHALVTARDIIFLWVARMTMFGLELAGDVPFTDVYINPTVLDIRGRRMSKSLGTGIDPLVMVDRYGADSLRFALISRCTGEQDIRFDEKMIADTRTFANKVWNIARFAALNLDPAAAYPEPSRTGPALADRWILSRYARLERTVTGSLEAFEFATAARSLYDFLWSEFADWYVEWVKPALRDRDSGPGTRDSGQPGRAADEDAESRSLAARATLAYVLSNTMKLLHPIMPHLTEEVWQRLPHEGDSIMVAAWPEPRPDWIDPEAEARMEVLIETIRAIRSVKADLGLATQTPPVVLRAEGPWRALIEVHRGEIRSLARTGDLSVDGERPAHAAAAVAGPVEILVPMAPEAAARARERLEKELGAVERDLGRVEARLANPEFAAKAPRDVVEAEEARRGSALARRAALERYLRSLG